MSDLTSRDPIVGDWQGHPHFGCPFCPFTSLSEDVFDDHMRAVHHEPEAVDPLEEAPAAPADLAKPTETDNEALGGSGIAALAALTATLDAGPDDPVESETNVPLASSDLDLSEEEAPEVERPAPDQEADPGADAPGDPGPEAADHA